MEPLVSDRPGKPVYLTEGLNAKQRQTYELDLKAIKAEAEKLLPDVVSQRAKMAMVVRCLDNVLSDLRFANSQA